ncbi:HNH endonuclease [Microcystis phage MJing1]|nr:HNH endonuclease [Microcystis phage MJing1]
MLDALDPFDPRVALQPLDGVRIWLDDFCAAWGLVSEEDAAWVLQHRWSAHVDQRGKHYVRRVPTIAGRRTPTYLHREVMLRIAPPPTPEHRYVDHLNGQGRDNRRENLRWATASENARNVHGLQIRQTVLFDGRML